MFKYDWASPYVRKSCSHGEPGEGLFVLLGGRPNLMAGMFTQWVNDDLLLNATLEPGFPRSISVQTGHNWMHRMGYSWLCMQGRVP